jgi:hypothetical protein
MNGEGEGYLLARLLTALFGRERLGCAYAVFVAIILLLIAILFVRAESLDDMAFPIIALIFILAYILVDGIHMIRRRSISDFQSPWISIQPESTFASVIEEEAEPELAPVNPPSKAPSSPGTYFAGGILAVALMFPVMCLGYFAISMLANVHDSPTALAFATFFILISCAVSPFAAIIGVIATRFAVRSARWHSPDANLTRPLLITGALIGVITGLIGIAIQYYLICIDGKACGI